MSCGEPDGRQLGAGFTLGGVWRVEPKRNLISRDGVQHRVPGKFMAVLVHLAECGGVASRREIFDAVWPDQVVVDECLTRAVSELRKAFGDDARRPALIETIPKKGYRLVVPAVALPPGATLESTDRRFDRPLVPHRNAWMIGATAGLAAVLVAVSVVVAGLTPGVGRPDSEGPQVVPADDAFGYEALPALSPDGDRLVYDWEYDLEHSQRAILVLTLPDPHQEAPSWSPHGQWIYVSPQNEAGWLVAVPDAAADGGYVVLSTIDADQSESISAEERAFVIQRAEAARESGAGTESGPRTGPTGRFSGDVWVAAPPT